MACRVLIVEDDDAFAEILGLLVEGDPRFALLGRARDGAEGVELAARLRPDVIAMDIDMPRMDGIEATCRILERNEATGVVIVSGSIFADRIEQARAAGARGYVPKLLAVAELLEVLLAACRGRAFIDARQRVEA